MLFVKIAAVVASVAAFVSVAPLAPVAPAVRTVPHVVRGTTDLTSPNYVAASPLTIVVPSRAVPSRAVPAAHKVAKHVDVGFVCDAPRALVQGSGEVIACRYVR
jgi:hypothetical protein